jgi:riboflavin kinase/FMN adenylyltransferase
MLTGHVGSGRQIGRSIGFPTANIRYDDPFKQLPADGVYAVIADFSGSTRKGMLNIGFRPTVDDSMARSVEVHVFDTDTDLYGHDIAVRFVIRLRDEMKFNGLNELQAQLSIDRSHAVDALKNF